MVWNLRTFSAIVSHKSVRTRAHASHMPKIVCLEYKQSRSRSHYNHHANPNPRDELVQILSEGIVDSFRNSPSPTNKNQARRVHPFCNSTQCRIWASSRVNACRRPLLRANSPPSICQKTRQSPSGTNPTNRGKPAFSSTQPARRCSRGKHLPRSPHWISCTIRTARSNQQPSTGDSNAQSATYRATA